MDTIEERAITMYAHSRDVLQSDNPHTGGLFDYFVDQLAAAVDAERERQEWLFVAALVNALKMDGIKKVVDKFLEYREFFDGWTVEQMRNQARGIEPKKEELFAAAIRKGDE